MSSQETIDLQRKLTVTFLKKRRLTAPVVWFDPESSTPSGSDAGLVVDLDFWKEQNLGARLINGFIELRIKTDDERFSKHLFAAFDHLKVDARAAFGSDRVSSILLKIADPATIEAWRELWPKGFKGVKTEFVYSLPAGKTTKQIFLHSQPLPGSVVMGKPIVWRPLGKTPAKYDGQGFDDFEARPVNSTEMEQIVRAIAWATLSYWIEPYLDGLTEWDESLLRIIGGWIARLVLEGKDINARGKSLDGKCWAPVDSAEIAVKLIKFLNININSFFVLAEAELERNPLAKVPGWRALETALGIDAKIAIRRAYRAGIDIDVIEHFSERYIFNRSINVYLDRESLVRGLPYVQKLGDLISVHENEPIFIKGKPHNPFRLYNSSQLRTDISHHDFFPGEKPGSILRMSTSRGLLNGEDRQPDEYRLLNTFPGFSIQPIGIIDPAIMAKAISMVDKMFGLLTRDNDAQVLWLKKFIAWTIQHPGEKQQVCPVIIGGQGIGKSIFGGDFMKALFGPLAGSADAKILSNNKFAITPFIDKLITHIDEVRLESIGAINNIKNIARNVTISGETKYLDQRDYNIWSRLVLTSNHIDIGLTPDDAIDRALFFVRSWDGPSRQMMDNQFRSWTLTLKPFYQTLVTSLRDFTFRQHLMRYFIDLECTREEIEDISLSSRNDHDIVLSLMSKARIIARGIAADARVLANKDITNWFNFQNLREAIKRIDGGASTKVSADAVYAEFDRAGVIEPVEGEAYYKFKYGYGKILQRLSEVHDLPLKNTWAFQPGDFDDNDVRSVAGGRDWRGKLSKSARGPFQGVAYIRDPDYMPPEE